MQKLMVRPVLVDTLKTLRASLAIRAIAAAIRIQSEKIELRHDRLRQRVGVYIPP